MDQVAKIQKILTELEKEHEVRVLYAVESGSRAWGFASNDSDWDVRFVYVRSVRDYIRIRARRDVIELPIEEDLDINGWDIIKALNLFRSSNPPLLEWLNSPIIYREEGDLASQLRTVASSSYSQKRLTYHYLSMAKGNYKDYIAGKSQVRLKKYLYTMRPLICIRWMEQKQTPSPTSIHEALGGIELANEIRSKLSSLIEKKQNAGELGEEAPDMEFNAWIDAELARIEGLVAGLPDSHIAEETLNQILWAKVGI